MPINNLSQFRNFIRTELGGGQNGPINVEISVEALDQSIDKAIRTFQRYNYGEGLYENYMTIVLSAGVSAYDLSGSDVTDVVDFSLSMATSNNITNLFTPANLVLGGTFSVLNGDGAGLSLTNYQIAMNYLETLSEIFSVKHRFDYIELQERLVITPTPTSNMIALLKVYKKENTLRLYNHLHVQDLAVALSKQIWGKALTKITGMPLPGGGSLSEFGRDLIQEGKEDQKEIIKRMTNEGEPNMFFMIG